MTSKFEGRVFKYVNDPLDLCDTDASLHLIPTSVSCERELMDWFQASLGFPEYFGKNWDALNDCLCYLEGINSRQVVLFHHDIPFKDALSDRATYLGVLESAVLSWKSSPEHELIVAFDIGCQQLIYDLRLSQSNRH